MESNREEREYDFQGHYIKEQSERENQLMYMIRERRKRRKKEGARTVPGIHAAVNSIQKHRSSQKPIAI